MKLTTTSRYIYYFSIAFVVASFGATIFFLYTYFYQAIAQVQTVYMLRSQVSFEIVDLNLWQKVKQNLDYKKTPAIKTDETIRNPFIN
ncbi:MAG TPA: hypothetical protein PLH37_02405 [bacterium]|nr:hypothetical protein [bacterium]